MNSALLAVALTALWQCRYRPGFDGRDCLSKESTCAVNGIFVLFVFLRHFSQYISYGRFDRIFAALDRPAGQLLVGPVLFYSGYGIDCSIARKGTAYVRQFPRQRILRVWYHFFLAILLYLVCGILLGRKDSPADILLSFTGWRSIGNSNWYIFAVLCLYAFTYLAFLVWRRHPGAAGGTVFLLCGIYVAVMLPIKDRWWYDTVFAYPAGLALGWYLSRRRLPDTPGRWALAALVCLLLSALTWHFRGSSIWVYACFVVVFCLDLVLLTMKIKVGNPILTFLGKYTFEIYILQRIPMMLLEKWMPIRGIWKAPYFVLSLALTLALALLFRQLTQRLDRALGLS